MKKWIKLMAYFILSVLLLVVIDLICIYTLNRPLFAIKEDAGDSVTYRGVFYDTYNCQEHSMPQIKAKGAKFMCLVHKGYNK